MSCPDEVNHHLYTKCGTCGERFKTTRDAVDELSNTTPAGELERWKRLMPACDLHRPTGPGARSRCLICAIGELEAVLSRIDYICGEPNELEVSDFDIHCNPAAVFESVKRAIALKEMKK